MKEHPVSTQRGSSIQDRLLELTAVFSQADIARRTEVPQASLSRYIGGQRVPADVCGRIADRLAVRAEWLLTGRGACFVTELDAGEQPVAGELRRLLGQVVEDGAQLVCTIESTDDSKRAAVGMTIQISGGPSS